MSNFRRPKRFFGQGQSSAFFKIFNFDYLICHQSSCFHIKSPHIAQLQQAFHVLPDLLDDIFTCVEPKYRKGDKSVQLLLGLDLNQGEITDENPPN